MMEIFFFMFFLVRFTSLALKTLDLIGFREQNVQTGVRFFH